MKYLKTIWIITLYILLFLLLNNEEIYLGPVKLSVLWKLPIILFLLVSAWKILPSYPILLLSTILSLKLVLNAKMGYGLSKTANEAFYVLVFAIVFVVFSYKFRNRPESLLKVLVFTSSFFILSSLPFLLGLLQQRTVIEVLDVGDESAGVLTGVFYHMSISSQIFSISTIVILFSMSYFKKHNYMYLWYALVLLGVYDTYAAFTRTGWLILLVGAFFWVREKIGSNKLILASVAVGFVLSALAPALDRDSPVYKRLIGESKHTSNENLDLNTITSGRLAIFEATLDNVFEEGVPGVLFGVGKDYSGYMNEKKLGTSFSAHNRFIEIFAYGGTIGLVLFIWYLIKIKKVIFSLSRDNPARNLVITLFLIMLFTLFPSHGFNMYSDFVFGCAMAYAAIVENNLRNRKRLSSQHIGE